MSIPASEREVKKELYAWASAFIRSGTGGAVPLPYGLKTPPPAGFTGAKNDMSRCTSVDTVFKTIRNGYDAHDPDTQVLRHYDCGGIGIRLADGIAGIDIDAYGAKAGATRLAELEEDWGELPPTYYLTSRGARQPSRIMLYRATAGVRYGNPGGDIDVIQNHHRYVIGPPSIHPKTGKLYVLYGPDDSACLIGDMPESSELAILPAAWDRGLREFQSHSERREIPSEEAVEWLRANGSGESCEQMDATLALWTERFRSRWIRDGETEFSVHNTGLAAAHAVIGDCAAGHEGAWDTLQALRAEYFAAGETKGKYPAGMEDDWRRSVTSAISEYIELASRPDDYCPESSRSADEEFWKSRPVLSHIRDWARAKRAAPWATFGEVLAEVVCHTTPALQLPDYIGGYGTLNMLIAITGKSGAGKNSASQVAGRAFDWKGIGSIEDKVERLPIGSGEGIAKMFGYSVRDKETGQLTLLRTETSIIITIPEIDTYTAINSRSGSTLSPELRKLYSGERLGFSWSDPTKKVIIPEHEYRAAVIAGVQPGRGEAIIGDSESGFAQRWLWLPAIDRMAPAVRPGEPDVLSWEPPNYKGRIHIMKVCEIAADEIDADRVESLHDSGDDMGSHALYTRLKVAAGLALLDGRDSVGEDDWELSAYVMRVSDRTRNMIAAHLQQKASEANVARGRAEGVRIVAANRTVQDDARLRISQNVLKHVRAANGWISYVTLRNKIAQRDRDEVQGIIDELVTSGTLESREIVYQNQPGIQYRIARGERTYASKGVRPARAGKRP
jgi:hypothetical protein